jgi:YD repeat-containing protein
VQFRDAADNVKRRATGLALPGADSSDQASVPQTSKVAYTYDARNRVTGTGFADGSPSIGRSYRPDGLPWTVVSNGSTWTYGYDARRLLRTETLATGETASSRHCARDRPMRSRAAASNRSP